MAFYPNNVGGSVEFAELDGAVVITQAEGISSNDNDTTIPTSAAVKDYVDTSGGIANVVEDTTPQLGGNLDLNGSNITGSGDISITSTNGVDINPGSDTDADLITVGVTGAPKILWDESSDGFRINGSTGVILGSAGDLAHTITGASVTSQLEVHSESTADLGGISVHRHSDTSDFGGHLLFLKSRGSHATPTVATDNTTLGRLVGLGYDGTDYELASEVRFRVDGTPGNNDMPGDIAFLTNGGSQTLTERMTIASDGSVNVAGLTASEIVATDASKNLQSLTVATYPSLTELSYVKGVTSAIQTQLGAKAPTASPTFTGTVTLPTGLTGVIRTDSGVVSVDTDVTDIVSAASDSAAGKVELAIASEVTTGTDTARAITPDALAGSSVFGVKAVCLQVTAFDGAVSTGDGQAIFTVPAALNGMNLIRAQATVYTAGTTNATTIMIRNKTDAADMLSGAISIASGGTVGTVGTINTATDDVATDDVIAVDVDTVSTTAPQGLMVVLEFQLP